MRRVAVTGLGLITPLGVGVRRSWKRLLDGDCGISSIQGLGFQKLQCRVAGIVPEGEIENGEWTARDWLTQNDERRMTKWMQYAVVAAKEALDDAGWHPKDPHEQEMTGICLGSGIGSFEDIYENSLTYHEHGPKKISPHFVPRLLTNLAAGHISLIHSLRGPNHSVSTACTTGAHSLGDAARLITTGEATVMLAGGSESCIHPLAITGFERSRSLTTTSNAHPSRASRPFNRDRDGFVMGEGAGVMVLEELEHARARGAHIYALLASAAYTADAHHATHPPLNGEGAQRAMSLALRRAGILPSDVDYVNAHATSTPLGDAAENRAIEAVLMDAGYGKKRHEDVHVSSTKGATGHLLGAAGAVEGIFSVLAIRDGCLPPTLNLRLEDIDREGGDGFRFDYVPLEQLELGPGKVNVVLSNSFGFGGTNACLCFKTLE
ncbi:MAG: Mitochondrial beta-keto-acyl synthase [Icmadophila ericetorum]|nr:Mitochondrial beta-keto-acyl synthase [Icmadophila ericetorum]